MLDKSLRTYARVLHKFTYALLLTRDESHPSNYDFLLTDHDKVRAEQLVQALQKQWITDQAEEAEEPSHTEVEGDDEHRKGKKLGKGKKNKEVEKKGDESGEEENNNNEDEDDDDDDSEDDDDDDDDDDDNEEDDNDDNDEDNNDDNEEDNDDDNEEDNNDDNEEDDDEDTDDGDDDDILDSDLICSFHAFICPFLYPRAQSTGHKPSKWNNPIERFMAVYSLQADRTFRKAQDVTQLFAILTYHIRGAILYQGFLNCDNFDGNLYRYVYPLFNLYLSG